VARASTTPSVAKEIKAHIDRCANTPTKRAKLYRDIKERPETFFTRIGINGIAEKTSKDVEKAKTGPIRTRETKVTFERLPKASKPSKTSATPTEPRAMTSQQQLLESTNQLVSLVKDLLATTSINNALGITNREPLLDVPPFHPRITPAPLPTTQPADILHDFGLGSFMTQDIVMNEAEADTIEGVGGLDEGFEGTGEGFEKIDSEEAMAEGELA
jgi:hypothetical protein